MASAYSRNTRSSERNVSWQRLVWWKSDKKYHIKISHWTLRKLDKIQSLDRTWSAWKTNKTETEFSSFHFVCFDFVVFFLLLWYSCANVMYFVIFRCHSAYEQWIRSSKSNRHNVEQKPSVYTHGPFKNRIQFTNNLTFLRFFLVRVKLFSHFSLERTKRNKRRKKPMWIMWVSLGDTRAATNNAFQIVNVLDDWIWFSVQWRHLYRWNT